MQTWSKNKKRQSRTLCFVPTMGYLHQGHVSLLEKGRTLCDELILSIFVNPTQFGPNEDLSSYPSNIANDLRLAEKAGTTAVFLPDKNDMYPDHFQTTVTLKTLPDHLCGKSRPGHFAGVATVVTKLFNIVRPDVAVFGMKDYQQLQVIRRMVRDLDFDIRIVGGEIVRESDGLAMSSRNAYLTETQRASAVSLRRSLNLARELIEKGERDAQTIRSQMMELIHSFPETLVEYVSFCDPDNLDEVSRINFPVLLALAVRVGTTRLIDNALIDL